MLDERTEPVSAGEFPAGRQGGVGYLVSNSFRERLAQRQRDKIADEVARGDEAAVNARIGRFRSFVP